MFARLALETDEDAFVAMASADVRETLGQEPSEVRLRETFHRYLDTANPTVWVVERERRAIGFTMAVMNEFDYRDGFYVAQRVIYVSPENRGTRAAVLLIKELVAWARRIGADEIVGGNDNGFQSERTARFLEHFGFKKVGFAMSMNLAEIAHG